jgi:hypothetical protein
MLCGFSCSLKIATFKSRHKRYNIDVGVLGFATALDSTLLGFAHLTDTEGSLLSASALLKPARLNT